jgi:hypothetical protein
LSHKIGREGFEDLTIEDIAELTIDEAPNEEQILESISENVNESTLVSSSDDEGVIPLSASTILEGLQLANKLGNHFLTNDDNVERAVQFQRDLKMIMARYEESYKELTKTKSQRLITEFAFKTSETRETQDVNFIQDTLVDKSPLNISSDESDFSPPKINSKRARLLSSSDTE